MTGYTPNIVDLGVNPDVETRLLPYVDSFVKWELLRFLNDNPGTTATMEELARYIGRDETEVKPAIRTLAAGGFVEQIETETNYAYSIVDDEAVRTLIQQLVDAYIEDRLVRLVISSHILKAQREAGRLQQLVS